MAGHEPLDEARLRELAEDTQGAIYFGDLHGLAMNAFKRACTPATILALLNALSAERERGDRAVPDYVETLGESEVQYEVWSADTDAEFCAGSDSLSEAQHYAVIYGQDHPVQIIVATTYRKPLATQKAEGAD